MKNQKNLSFRPSLARATGAGLGLALGIVGPLHPIGVCLILSILLFRCRLAWALVAGLAGWGISLAMNPSSIGLALLEFEGLQSLWTRLYNTPILALSGFNETKVMGGLCAGATIFFATFFFLLLKPSQRNSPPSLPTEGKEAL